MHIDVWGDNSPWVSRVPVHLVNRGSGCHFSRLSFKGRLYSKQAWKIGIVSPSAKAGLFSPSLT